MVTGIRRYAWIALILVLIAVALIASWLVINSAPATGAVIPIIH
jgi:hypothetical protein